MPIKPSYSYTPLLMAAAILQASFSNAAPYLSDSSLAQSNLTYPRDLNRADVQKTIKSPTLSEPYQHDTQYRLPPKPHHRATQALKIPITTSLQAFADTQTRLANTPPSPIVTNAPFANEIALAAHAVALDPNLVHAIIYVESRYQHPARSVKGAIGLMQVMPDTAQRYGLREAAMAPSGNIKAGTLYLRDLMAMFNNRLDLVLAAYNAGEGAVRKYAYQIPPYPETQHYVKAVMAKYALNIGTIPTAPEIHQPQLIETAPLASSQVHYLDGTALKLVVDPYQLNRGF